VRPRAAHRSGTKRADARDRHLPALRRGEAQRGVQDQSRARLARDLAREAENLPAAQGAGLPVIPSADAEPFEFILPPLFTYQNDLVRNPAWELVIVSATQIGKTFACACWLLAQAFEHPHTLNWWCGPTKRQALNGYNTLKRIALSAGLLKPGRLGYTDSKMALHLWNGAEIECRSWKVPANLQGDSIWALVVDEAGLLTGPARSMMGSRQSALLGPTRYIGNPGPAGSEFWRLHQQATEGMADPEQAGYWDLKTWTWQTRHAALSPMGQLRYKAFIDRKRKTEHPYDFARLYEASWEVPEKSIFGKTILRLDKEGLLLPRDPKPHPSHPYLVAWDIGVTSDYTVGAPLCLKCFTVTDYHRERPGDTHGLPERIVAYTRHWNEAQAVVERNGLGITIFNDVARLYKKVQGWQTDNINKRAAVFEALNRLEKGGLTIFRDPVMLKELTAYESQQNPKTQTWSFGAPDGANDDIVMGILIAVGAATSGGAAYIEMMKRQLAEMKQKQQKAAA
jgi:terminase large subunit-like protein